MSSSHAFPDALGGFSIEEQVFLLTFAEGDLALAKVVGDHADFAGGLEAELDASGAYPSFDGRAGAKGGVDAFLHEVESDFGFMDDGWRVYSGVCTAMKGW
jgi:hypothetical protein